MMRRERREREAYEKKVRKNYLKTTTPFKKQILNILMYNIIVEIFRFEIWILEDAYNTLPNAFSSNALCIIPIISTEKSNPLLLPYSCCCIRKVWWE